MNFPNLASTFLIWPEKGTGSRIPGSHFFATMMLGSFCFVKLYFLTNKNKQKDSDAVNCVGGKNMVVMEWFAATGTTVRWLETRKRIWSFGETGNNAKDVFQTQRQQNPLCSNWFIARRCTLVTTR